MSEHRFKIYPWATCPCGWQLILMGMPRNWRPDPEFVEGHLLAHQFKHALEQAESRH